MPAQIVFITGINGFIGAHTALRFLQEGWFVRGTVRSAEKAEKFKKLPEFTRFVEDGKVDIVIEADLASADLKKLLTGVSAICHIAIPLQMEMDISWEQQKQNIAEPILKMMRVANKIDTIKNLIFMSSAASVLIDSKPWNDPSERGKVYDEQGNATYSDEMMEKLKGDAMRLGYWYAGSKVVTEETVNKFVKDETPSYKVAIMLPAMTHGPPVHVTSIAELASALTASHMGLLLSGKNKKIPATYSTLFVDVRDVGNAFFQAVQTNATGRFLLYSQLYDNQIFANEMRKQRPDLDAIITLGDPEKIPSAVGSHTLDASKAKKELKIKFHSFEECIADSLEHMEKHKFFV